MGSLALAVLGRRRRVAADVHAETRHAIADLAQRQPEAHAGRGAVVTMLLQRAHENVALDLVEAFEIPDTLLGAPIARPDYAELLAPAPRLALSWLPILARSLFVMPLIALSMLLMS